MTTPAFPAGVWPPMLTPLTADRRIDWAGVDRLTDWYLESGVAGLFAVAQSSEMFALDDAERLALAHHVVRRVAGRVPVVASGTFDRPVAAQAAFMRRMADTGVAAVTVLTGMMAAEDEDDAVWRGRVEHLLTLTDPLPLALYECPAPYHRLLSPALVAWAAATGRFHLLKETSRSVDAVHAKIAATHATPLGLYNADATTLLPSLRAGGHGYCGIAANVYPEVLVRLCATFATAPEAAERLQDFLTVADGIVHTGYPVTAKTYLAQRGLEVLPVSRVSSFAVTDYHQRVLAALAREVANCQSQSSGASDDTICSGP